MPTARPSPGRVSASNVCSGLVGLGMGGVVASDGSPFWAAARVLTVAVVCAVVALAPHRQAYRALASTVLGAVATPVGATIGYSYLATTGPSVTGVAGMVAFAGGLGALVLGAVHLVRSVRGWFRLAAVPVAVLVVYVVMVPLFVAVYATNVPRPRIGSITPADRGLAYDDASFVTSDGVTLSGWYIPSRNRAAVVLLHGASSTRSNVLDHALVLAGSGYGVLLYDARGHGRSGGRAMELGWYGDRDIAAAVDYLETRSDVDPLRIAALGLSMGGEQAIGAMAADPRIRAVVAEGATNRVFADKAWLPHEYGIRGRLQQGIDWVKYNLIDLLTAADPPVALRNAAAAAVPRPILLIAAGDVEDEQLASAAIQRAAPANVEVWVVPGAGHTGGLRTMPDDWESRVAEFFSAAVLTS